MKRRGASKRMPKTDSENASPAFCLNASLEIDISFDVRSFFLQHFWITMFYDKLKMRYIITVLLMIYSYWLD